MPSFTSWGSKLDTKLTALATTSSKETLQTLAKWIAFNRKRSGDFIPVLLHHLREEKVAARKVVLLGVVHEVLIAEKASTANKWDRLESLRLALGEGVFVPVLVEDDGELDATVRAKVQDLIKEWDDANVFGGPLLLNQIRKKLSQQQETPTEKEASSSSSPKSQSSKSPEKKQKKSPPPSADTKQDESAETSSKTETPKKSSSALGKRSSSGDGDKKVAAADTPAKPSSTSSPASKEISYDFEQHGIPAAHVEPREFQAPCRAIATLQIARDLRNDGAIQLSTLLSAMPEDIRAACAQAAENDNHYEIDETKARDFSLRMNAKLLQVDLDEQLQSAQTFRGIVERQRQARSQLIQLLIKSRCKFGADEAAEAFYKADRAKEELLRRKQILTDALELEGVDVEETPASQKKDAGLEEELAPLTWYKGAGAGKEAGASDSQPEAKKLRAE